MQSLFMRTSLVMFGLLSACSTSGTYEGRLVDGLTGEPRAGVLVLGKGETDKMSCQVVEGTTDADGKFTWAKTCKDVNYTLETKDKTLLVANAPKITGGEKSAGPVELMVWRAPTSDGLQILKEDKLSGVATRTRIMAEEKLVGTETVAAYPKEKFKSPSAVPEGGYLVVAGKGLNSKLKFVPIVPQTGKVVFASGTSLEGHVFLGMRFTSETTAEPVTASLDESGVKTVTDGERVIRYLPTSALPAGQYALYAEGDKDTQIVGFGKLEAEPTATATPPTGG